MASCPALKRWDPSDGRRYVANLPTRGPLLTVSSTLKLLLLLLLLLLLMLSPVLVCGCVAPGMWCPLNAPQMLIVT